MRSQHVQFDANDALISLNRYNRFEVTKIDLEAKSKFFSGLDRNLKSISEQVDFVLYQYGGLSSERNIALVNRISEKIYNSYSEWEDLVSNAEVFSFDSSSWNSAIPSAEILDCFSPLRKIGDAAQIRCATKFLHLLNPHAFVIVDHWIGSGLGINVDHNGNSALYRSFVEAFGDFVNHHKPLIPLLKKHDQPGSWSEIKLMDKILLCRKAALQKMDYVA